MNVRNVENEDALLCRSGMDGQRCRIILERTNTVVIEWNSVQRTFYRSPGTEEFMFSQHLRTRLERAFLSFSDVHPGDWQTARAAVRRLMDGDGSTELTVRLLRKDGDWLWCRCTATAIRETEGGKISRLIVTINDVDAAVKAQRALAYRVEFDQLTGYGNFDKYKREVREILRNRGGRKYSLWYSDLKNFKYINDIYGYDTGDKLLRHWADVIARDLRQGECFARISADNFTLFRAYGERAELEERFAAVTKDLQTFETLVSRRFPVEVVSGIYCVERDEDLLSVEDMIDRANMAQKSVKPLPGSRLAFYTEEMRSRVILEKAMESDMVRAMREGEFRVYLQGQVDIQHDNRISGAEALARWDHPARGMVPPSQFVPLFEKNGFIVELDRYIFECVCRYLAGRIQRGEPLFRIAVNASRLTLLQPDFLERYTGIKDAYGIPDGLLELECTETVLIENLKEIGDAAARLRDSGFLLGMDDFGSGYSSLNVLKDVVVDILKLDMAFFQNGLTKERDRAIVASIVSMAGALDMRVVAEGVETMEQVNFLRRIGCEVVQGYVFFRPVPMDDFRPDTVFRPEKVKCRRQEGSCRDAELKALSLLANGVPCAAVQAAGGEAMTIRAGAEHLPGLTGYTPAELRERFENAFSALIIPADAGRVRKAVERLEDNWDHLRLDYRIRRKDGAVRWLMDTRFPGPDGGCFCILTDVTSIHELEETARQALMRLQKIMDNMTGGICIFEWCGSIQPLFMNRGYYDMFGYTEDEYWRERAGNIMANLFPEDARRITQAVEKAAGTQEPFELIYRLHKRDGSVGHVQMRAVELPGEEGQCPVFLALLSDISAIKETEQRLEEILEQQKGRLEEKLRQAEEALKRAVPDGGAAE